MQCDEIISILERQSPREYALEWDHVGLLVGRREKEVKKVMVTLDVTLEAIEHAKKEHVDMIVSHHPMIFGKIDRVNDDTVLGRKILALAEAGICCYAMHTNFDTKGGMAKIVAQRLGLQGCEVLEETQNGEGIGQIGFLKSACPLSAFVEQVKEQFSLPRVAVFGDLTQTVEKIALCPGSGKSVIEIAREKEADCLLTGDIGHHDGMDAVELGMSVIDASHYGLEQVFVEFMCGYLEGYMPDIELVRFEAGLPFVHV